MIDYFIEMVCIYVCAISWFYYVEFYVLVYYHVDYCKVEKVLVHCHRYVLSQMFN